MSKRTNKEEAIGVFDSGLGGLTVVKQLLKQLPTEDIIYFGDTARVPYGTKSKESIIRFSIENTKILLDHNVKVIVVACNSSSAYALSALQNIFRIPIIGVIEPGVQEAIAKSKNKRIGVIATSATVNSHAYKKAIELKDSSVVIYEKACPLFVPVIEEGWAKKDIAQSIAKEYLSTLLKRDIDTLVLGCTHYPLLKSTLKKVACDITLIDSAQAVAKLVKIVLCEEGLQTSSKKEGYKTFLVSDRPQNFQRIAKGLLGQELKNIKEV
jgi:glutamate racemase